jgi:glycosyltransferase involved in cell wall biosynthesis
VPTGPASPAAAFAADRVNLIFVGRHDRQKGLDILLDVFRRHALPGVHLHVLGAPVLATADTAGQGPLPANVTIHGWQNRDQVSAMMARADALVVPSRWEGFGLVAAEAMRMGKPVIASRRGALAEIVENGRSGFLFDLDDREAIAALLASLSREQLAGLGEAARARFLQSFTADRLNAELASLYGTLSEERMSRPAPAAVERDNTVPSLGPERFGG